MNSEIVRLKSAGLAKVLLWLLRIELTKTILLRMLIFMEIGLLKGSSIISAGQHLSYFLFIPSIVLNLVILLLSLVWIYRLHDDLNQCYSHYPINAWNAVWSVIFIILIWKTLMTIARHFQAETGRLQQYGLLLQRLVPILYGIFITFYLLNKLLYGFAEGIEESMTIIPESLVPAAIALKHSLGLVGEFILLAIAQTIVNAMQLKVHRMNQAKACRLQN